MRTVIITLLAAALALAALAQAPGGRREGRPEMTPVTVEGKVKELGTMEGPRGQKVVTVTITTTDRKTVTVALAPQQRLDLLGVKLTVGTTVKVTGVKSPRQPEVVMGRELTVGGKTYALRGSEIDGLPAVTVQGVVKKVILPEPPAARAEGATKPAAGKTEGAAKPDAAPPRRGAGPMMPVTLLLQTDKELLMIHLVPPPQLEKANFKPVEGQKLTIAGWKRELPPPPAGAKPAATTAPRPVALIIARTVTLDKTTVTLRDENGRPVGLERPAGQGRAEGRPGQGQGQRQGQGAAKK